MHICAMGVVNLVDYVYSVNYGSSWISTTEGAEKSQSGHRDNTNKIYIECCLLLHR